MEETTDNLEVTVLSTREGQRSFLAKLTPQQVAEFVEIGNQLVLTYVAVGKLAPADVPAYRNTLVTDELAAIDAELKKLDGE